MGILDNIIAHRGYYNKYIKENSLLAFKKAIIFNYVIELDVYLRDDDIVVTHNYIIDKVPLLKEVLDLVKGRTPLIIDIKSVNIKIVSKLITLLDNYKGEFVVISFNPLILLLFKLYRPSYRRGLLLLYDYHLFKTPLFIKLVKPDYLFLNYQYYNDKRFNHKIPIIGWTIDSLDKYLKYKNYFDNLVCDIYKIT